MRNDMSKKLSSVQPDSALLTGVLKGFCRFPHKFIDVLEIFRTLGVLPDKFSHSVVMKSFIEAARLDDAVNYMKSLLTQRVDWDIVTFTPLLQHFARSGDVARLSELAELISKDTSIKMDAPALCTLLDGFLIGKDIRGLHKTLRFLESRAVSLRNQKEFNIALRACVRIRKIRLLFELLREMAKAGIEKNEITYTQILFARLFENDRKAVIRVLDEIDEKNLVLRSRMLYSALINFFLRAKDGQGVDRIADLLLHHSILTTQARITLLGHYKANSDTYRYDAIREASVVDVAEGRRSD
jgi:pentatricopeptide repeat protein